MIYLAVGTRAVSYRVSAETMPREAMPGLIRHGWIRYAGDIVAHTSVWRVFVTFQRYCA